MKEKREMYDNGQTKYLKNPNGREVWYDEAGHITRIRRPDGREDIREYNEDGICIYYKSYKGDIYKYNDKHLPIYKKTNNIEEFWEYDETDSKCTCHILKEYFN